MTCTECGNLTNVTCAYDDSMFKPSFTANPPLTLGSGDITTNVLDLLEFDRALFSGKLLGSDGLEMMLTFVDGYSCGWMQDSIYSGLHTGGNNWRSECQDDIYHQGRIPGFLASNIILNCGESKIYVIILFSVDETEPGDLQMRIGEVLKYLDESICEK